MKRFSFSSLRFRLILIVLLASIPAMLLTVNHSIEDRSAATTRIKAETVQLTQLTVANQEQWVESARQLLIALGNLHSVRNRNSTECSEFMAQIKKNYPLYANLFADTPDGDQFCSAVPMKQEINAAQRAWFKRAVSSRDFSIGDYQIGPVSGLPVIVAAYPVYDENGSLQAVVSASIDLAWLNEQSAKTQLSPGATFRIIDQKGTILVRNPDPQMWVGQSFPEADIIKKQLNQHEGTIETEGVDGVRRFFAFAPVHSGNVETGLFVSNGIPASIAVTEINQILVRDLTGLSIPIFLMLVIAWFVSDAFVMSYVNTLIKATKRLGAGDLSVRTGLKYDKGEVGELARSFDGMVESLHEKEAQRKYAEDALKKSEEKFKTVADFAFEMEYWLDPQQELVYISPSAERISGYRPKEFIADAGLLYRIIHPDDKELYQQHMQKHFKGDDPDISEEVEFRIIARNGEVHWIHHVCCAVYNVEKQYLGRRVSNSDITQRKQAEDELIRYRERLEELVKERTSELNIKNEELERFNKLFVGRELRMIELKKKIKELETKIEELNDKVISPKNSRGT